jgi:fatty-acyl-CoA synthase
MNLSRIVERWADVQPDRIAIRYRGEAWTWRELLARVDHATARLAAIGVQPGDRVAWLGYNHPEMLAMLFGLARIGAMLVPLNFRLAVPELQRILLHAEASVLVAEPDLYAAAQELAAALPLVKTIGLRDAPAGWFAWEGEPPAGFSPRLRGEDASPVLIVYTSGTTGAPKGAVHTQSAILWNAVNSIHAHDLAHADHVLNPLPMFHVGGLSIQSIPVLFVGGTLSVHPRFDPGLWLRDVAAHRPTLSLLVPATMKAVIEHPDFARADLSSLRMLNSGSSTIPESLIRPFHDRGIPVGQVYGTTETGPISICLRAEDAMRKVGSSGKPAMHCEVRLVDEQGADLPRGAVGEILVRGLNLMQGYWRDPDNPSFRDGWFHTGDLARVDDEGYWWVVGRSKDMIISGGENVYPAELENILADCPDVAEAAVFGAPDPKWGEIAVAAVVRKPGAALDEAGILALFDRRIARFKHPRRILFLDALPRNAMGKVQKFELRRQFGEPA